MLSTEAASSGAPLAPTTTLPLAKTMKVRLSLTRFATGHNVPAQKGRRLKMPTVAWTPMMLAIALGLLGGCGEPCADLANKICGCEKTAAAKQACLDRVKSDGQASKATSSEQDRCTELEKTCTCQALACGNWEACGLALDSGFPASWSAEDCH
jgi:hypothetical protein